MFDRDTYPDVDSVLSRAEEALGARLQVQVEPLPDGFARALEPAADRPFALIQINERFRDVRHALAAFHALDLLRRRRSPLRATATASVQAEVQEATRRGFRDLPGDAIPGLARTLYDGMARQLVSSLR